MTGTVNEFRTLVFARAGVSRENYDKFLDVDMARLAFWEKLNRLGGRRVKQLPPEKVPDIDATVGLNEAEWSELEHELDALLLSA